MSDTVKAAPKAGARKIVPDLLRIVGTFFRDRSASVASWSLVGVVALAALFGIVRYTGILDQTLHSTLVPVGSTAPTGVLYRLPRTVVDVTVTARVVECAVLSVPAVATRSSTPGAGAPSGVAPLAPATEAASSAPTAQATAAPPQQRFYARVAVEHAVAPRVEADPHATFVLDTSSLDRGVWSTMLEVTLDASHLLAGLNVESASARPIPVSRRIPVSGSVSAPPSRQVSGAGRPRSVNDACGREIVTALEERRVAQKALAETNDVTLRRMRQAEIVQADAVLTREYHRTLVPTLAGSADKSDRLVNVDLRALFEEAGDDLRDLLGENGIGVVVTLPIAEPYRPPVSPIEGVVYRAPMPATIHVCRPECRVTENALSPFPGDMLLARTEVTLAHLGPTAALPIRRKLFSNRTVRLGFDHDGGLSKVNLSDRLDPPGTLIGKPELLDRNAMVPPALPQVITP